MSLKSTLKEVRVADNFRAGAYRKIDPATCQKIIAAAKPLRGLNVIHINSTAAGGGVAELLRSRVPFERALGLRSRWLVIEAAPEFFAATKRLHNLLQGKFGALSDKEKEVYLSTNETLSGGLRRVLAPLRSGIVVLHDPQPLPLVNGIPEGFKKISRLHIDLSSPNRGALAFIRPFIGNCDRVIVSDPNYARSLGAFRRNCTVVHPAIDPLSPKNLPLSPESAAQILANFRIDASRPLMTQVSRFDPWKDPLGVIEAYYIAKNKIPNLELTLAGFESAADDPQARLIFEKVKKYAKGDPSIHLFSDPKILKDVSGEIFVSALYAASTVIVQKSLREGFGLTVTEAMWKGKAVVAGRTRGTLLQIKSGRNGLIVSSPKAAAAAVVKLVKDEKLRARLGRAARESVRKKFLLPRLVLDNLKVYASVKKK